MTSRLLLKRHVTHVKNYWVITFCTVIDVIYFQTKIKKTITKIFRKTFKIHVMMPSIKFIRIPIFSSFFIIKQAKNIKSGTKSAQNYAKKT